ARSQYTGAVIIASSATGTVTLGSHGNVGSSGANNGFMGTIVLNRNVIFDSNASDRTDYYGISGTGNVTVTGTGRTIFLTTEPFNGNVTVATSGAGSFQTGTATAGLVNYIPDGSNVTINAGSIYRLSSGSEAINALLGSGTLNVNSINGTLIIGSSGASGTF